MHQDSYRCTFILIGHARNQDADTIWTQRSEGFLEFGSDLQWD